MQKVAVVYFPKVDVEKITNFREKYDPNWKIISPHITIVSPIPETEEEKLIEHVEKAVKGIKSFPLRLSGLMKTFDDCLFLLAKEGNDEIVNLHDKLYSGTFASFISTEFTFVPHITLGEFQKINKSFDEMLYKKGFTEAQELQFDIDCVFDEVSVIKGDGINPAVIVKTIHLSI